MCQARFWDATLSQRLERASRYGHALFGSRPAGLAADPCRAHVRLDPIRLGDSAHVLSARTQTLATGRNRPGEIGHALLSALAAGRNRPCTFEHARSVTKSRLLPSSGAIRSLMIDSLPCRLGVCSQRHPRSATWGRNRPCTFEHARTLPKSRLLPSSGAIRSLMIDSLPCRLGVCAQRHPRRATCHAARRFSLMSIRHQEGRCRTSCIGRALRSRPHRADHTVHASTPRLAGQARR